MSDERLFNGDSIEQVDSLPVLEETTVKTAPTALNDDIINKINVYNPSILECKFCRTARRSG